MANHQFMYPKVTPVGKPAPKPAPVQAAGR